MHCWKLQMKSKGCPRMQIQSIRWKHIQNFFLPFLMMCILWSSGRGGGANAAAGTVLLLVPRLRPPRRRPPPASVAPPAPCRRRILIFLPLVAGTPALQFRLEAVISRSICFRFSLVQITISISIRNQVAVVKLRDECMLPGSVGTIPSPVLLQL